MHPPEVAEQRVGALLADVGLDEIADQAASLADLDAASRRSPNGPGRAAAARYRAGASAVALIGPAAYHGRSDRSFGPVGVRCQALMTPTAGGGHVRARRSRWSRTPTTRRIRASGAKPRPSSPPAVRSTSSPCVGRRPGSTRCSTASASAASASSATRAPACGPTCVEYLAFLGRAGVRADPGAPPPPLRAGPGPHPAGLPGLRGPAAAARRRAGDPRPARGDAGVLPEPVPRPGRPDRPPPAARAGGGADPVRHRGRSRSTRRSATGSADSASRPQS